MKENIHILKPDFKKKLLRINIYLLLKSRKNVCIQTSIDWIINVMELLTRTKLEHTFIHLFSEQLGKTDFKK